MRQAPTVTNRYGISNREVQGAYDIEVFGAGPAMNPKEPAEEKHSVE